MKKVNLLFYVAVLGILLLNGCSNKKTSVDDALVWKWYDSLSFNQYDPNLSFDSLAKTLKEESNRSIISFMTEIRDANYKKKFNADSTITEFIYSDSIKSIYEFESDSLHLRLDSLSRKYPSNYLVEIAWGFFYNKVSDYEKEKESLIKAYKISRRPEVLVLLGDNAYSLYSGAFSRAGFMDTSKLVRQYAKERLNYYDSAIQIAPFLYTGLLRTAESLYAKGKTQRKDTDEIKELISRAIDAKPKWPQAIVVMTNTKSRISLMEYEEIYQKQIALGDSTQLYQVAIQKLNYNAQASLSTYKKTFKASEKSYTNAIEEAFILFSQRKFISADSTLGAMIKFLKTDTTLVHEPSESAAVYWVRAYQNRVYGRYTKALAYIDSCIIRESDYDPDYSAEKVMILLKLTKRNEARDYMTRYVTAIKLKYSSPADSTQLSARLTAFDQLRGYYDLN